MHQVKVYLVLLFILCAGHCALKCDGFLSDSCKGRVSSKVHYHIQNDPCPHNNADVDVPNVKVGYCMHKEQKTNVSKISLRIICMFTQNRLLVNQVGFKISIRKIAAQFHTNMPSKNFKKYLCFNQTKLVFSKNVKDKFLYLFESSSELQINPGDKYRINVTSLPSKSSMKRVKYYVPDCWRNDLKNLSYCISKATYNSSQVTYDCQTRRVGFSYSIPLECGLIFSILFCPFKNKIPESFTECFKAGNKSFLLKGPVEITLPQSLNLSGNYTSFIQCKNGYYSDPNFLIYVNFCAAESKWYIYASVCLVTVISVSVLCRYISKKRSASYSTLDIPELAVTETIFKHPKPNEKLLFIFLEDSPKYILGMFFNYLVLELQFNVICPFNEEKEIIKSIQTWAEKRLKETDKVLVIWSPKAECLYQEILQGNVTLSENYCDKIFQQVLTVICREPIQKNRYYFGMFDYLQHCNFSNHAYRCFNLMKEFEELFFYLTEINQYNLAEKKELYDCLKTEHGQVLCRALKKAYADQCNNEVHELKENAPVLPPSETFDDRSETSLTCVSLEKVPERGSKRISLYSSGPEPLCLGANQSQNNLKAEDFLDLSLESLSEQSEYFSQSDLNKLCDISDGESVANTEDINYDSGFSNDSGAMKDTVCNFRTTKPPLPCNTIKKYLNERYISMTNESETVL